MSATGATGTAGTTTPLSAKEARRSTVHLTHFGRKSGNPYRVTVWFVVVDGRVWMGSLSRERSWVKNVRASGRAELDFGSGPRQATFRWIDAPRDMDRFRQAIVARYPITARVLNLIVRGERCAFETDVRVAS